MSEVSDDTKDFEWFPADVVAAMKRDSEGFLVMPSYDYEDAMVLAGAEVHDFKMFGSYQGVWWAYVTCDDRTGYVRDYYGSCGGCDGIEAAHDYLGGIPDEQALPRIYEYTRVIREIGESALCQVMTLAEALKEIGPDPYGDDAEALTWIMTREEPPE